MYQPRVFDFLLTAAMNLYARIDTGGVSVPFQIPAPTLVWTTCAVAGQRSDEETEKANGNLWRCVVWERKFSAPDFEIAAGDSRWGVFSVICTAVFSDRKTARMIMAPLMLVTILQFFCDLQNLQESYPPPPPPHERCCLWSCRISLGSFVKLCGK